MFGAKKLILIDRLLFFRSYSLTLNKCFESLLYRLFFLPFQAIYKCLSNSADQCRAILCLRKPYKRKMEEKLHGSWNLIWLVTPVFCWHVANTSIAQLTVTGSIFQWSQLGPQDIFSKCTGPTWWGIVVAFTSNFIPYQIIFGSKH